MFNSDMKIIPQFSDWSGFINLPERVLLTDPCYKPGTWCSTEMSIKSGDWKACGFFPVDLRFAEYVKRQLEEIEEYKNETKIKIKRIFDKYNIDVDYDNMLERYKEQIKMFNDKDTIDVITYIFQLNSAPGFFDSDAINHFNEGRVQRSCSSMFMVHKDYQDDERFSQKNIHKTFKHVKPTKHNSLVDSGQIGIFDLEKYNKNYNKEFYKNCCDTYGFDKKGSECYSQYKNSKYYPYIPVHKDINGFNVCTYYGDMPFKLKTISDETGIIAIMINTKRF